MIIPPPYVSEDGYPASVRRLANWSAAQWDRIFEVTYEDTVSPKILLSDEKFSIILPKRGFGNGNVVNGGFKNVASGMKIRVYLGLVNSILPLGMTLGDVTPLLVDPIRTSGYTTIKVTVYDDSDPVGHDPGSINTVEIKVFEDAPDDTDTEFYLAIGTYGTTDGNLVVTPGGDGSGVGDQSFKLCGGFGGDPEWGPA